MKKATFLILLGVWLTPAFAQFQEPDSLKKLLQQDRSDTNKVLLLAQIGASYLNKNPESGFMYAQKGLELSRSIGFRHGEAVCFNVLGHLNRMDGNFTGSIALHIQALHISEITNDPSDIIQSYFGIAANYEDEGNYKEALGYYYKVMSALASSPYQKSFAWQGNIESNMGECFLNLSQLDSALKYEEAAYVYHQHSPRESLDLARLGNIQTAMGHDDLALSYFRMGVPVAAANSDKNALAELFSGITGLFRKGHRYDSCILYAKKELASATELGNPGAVADACSDLFASYKKVGNTDSALKYLELSSITKDTLITQDKTRQQQILSFQEKLREDDIERQRRSAAEKRSQNIQIAALTIGVICFIALFLLLSRSIIVNDKWIRFLGVLALLIVFEFINLIIHPYLAQYTNDSPFLMLFGLVLIGAMIVPLHHRVEKWVIRKMTEKNKIVRLTAAKRTIEELGGKGE